MHNAMQMLTDFLLRYLTHSLVALPLIAGAAWLGDRALRRVGPWAQHRMWVCALLCGVVLPMLPAHVLDSMISQQSSGRVTVSMSTTLAHVEPLHGSWAISDSLYTALAVFYLLCVLFSGARLLWRWRQTRMLLRRSTELPRTERVAALVSVAADRLGVMEPEIRCLPEDGGAGLRGPVVLGVRRAVLMVPEGFFEAAREDDIAAALAHECAHIARRDFAWNLVYESVTALVAYHPACWWMRQRVAETRELVCDEVAADALADRSRYAASLLRLATTMAEQATAVTMNAIGVFDANILEKRIMRLTTDLPKLSKVRRVAIASMAVCALVGGAATAAALSFEVTPLANAASSKPAQEKVYQPGSDIAPPVLTYSVDAEFSKKAKDAKYQGVSEVSLVVDSHGMPQHMHTTRKTGMGLDEKAIEAVRQYRFKPGTLHGKPVAVAIKIEVNFRRY